MILQIDAGNSRIKWRCRRQSRTLERGVCELAGLEQLVLPECPEAVWISSVAGDGADRALADWCRRRHWPAPRWARSLRRQAGVRNGYRQPASLGVDRWLALLGARSLAPCIVIDCGTAITADLLDARKRHLGGYIAPGRSLLSQTLGQAVSALARESDPGPPIDGPGRDTPEAIAAGLDAMIWGVVECARQALPGAALVFTGGDGQHWADAMAGGRYWPDLVLDGLECALGSESFDGDD